MSAQRAIVPLTGLDGVFLDLETPATPMHVASLHLFAKPEGRQPDFYGAVRRLLASGVRRAPVLGRRLAEVPLHLAHPVWVEGEEVDLDYHVRRVQVPAPGTQAALEDCVAELHSQLMDRSRPLWTIYVLEGLEDGRRAYYFKIHHAVLDGAAGVALAATLFDASPALRRSRRASPGTRGDRPGWLAAAGAAFSHDAAQYVRLVRYLPTAASALAGIVSSPAANPGSQLLRNLAFGPRTPLNVTVTAERRFAVSSLPLDELKAIGARFGATINDVVLALCGGTLRRYLARHGGVPRAPLIATMPISLRDPGDTHFGTAATLSLVNLATHIADPVRRLRAVRAAAGATKSLARSARSLIPTDFPSIGVPWIVSSMAALYGRSHLADMIPPIANVVISNVPGPQVPLYTAGARMEAYWPVSIVEHGLGLNITVLSYTGTLGFGFTAARAAVADARELASDLLVAHADLKRGASRRQSRTAGTTHRRARAG
ncbi:MAG TPA: wax ester/triacylglycerol synthase family O-acyltransferase [Steroidobacteraceae bacterium]|nr:wax ester/triacylglycerol synthase family O-acyltransferase [Steroidobacteraceae bacterium]